MEIYKTIYNIRTNKGSDTQGLAERFRQQREDIGNFYKSNKQRWDSHNEEIKHQQKKLLTLLDQARKMGCYVSPELYEWAYIKTPSIPW